MSWLAVTAHDAAATAAVIANLHTFQTDVTNFDAAQGGIFEARFDNELLGDTSTLGAEVTKMIEGLQTGNAALDRRTFSFNNRPHSDKHAILIATLVGIEPDNEFVANFGVNSHDDSLYQCKASSSRK